MHFRCLYIGEFIIYSYQLIFCILVPAELVKARMQTQSFETLGQCLKDAIGKERGGFFGLYTGYTATMIRDLPYFALQLG